MSLAPYGREGIFTALASAPLFAAKLPTGEAFRRLRKHKGTLPCSMHLYDVPQGYLALVPMPLSAARLLTGNEDGYRKRH